MSEILNLQTLSIAEPEHAIALRSTWSGSFECQIPAAED